MEKLIPGAMMLRARQKPQNRYQEKFGVIETRAAFKPISRAKTTIMESAITFFCLPKAVNSLFDNHYSLAFHGIMGVVIAATLMTVPFESFTLSTNACLINVFFLAAGAFTASVLDVLNSKVPREM